MQQVFQVAKSLGAQVGTKLLNKKNKKWGSLITQANAAGYTFPEVMDFFASKFDSAVAPENRKRPDEMEAEATQKRKQLPMDVAKRVIAAGTGLGSRSLLSSSGQADQDAEQQMPQQEMMSETAEVQTPQGTEMVQEYDLEALQAQHPDLYKTLIAKMQKLKDPSLATSAAKVRFGPQMSEIEEIIKKPFGDWFSEMISMRTGGTPTQRQTAPSQRQQGGSSSNVRNDILSGLASLEQTLNRLGQ